METEHVKLSDAAKYLLEECRMVLPGIQALFGFQLVAILNNRFKELTTANQALHYAALACTALSAALIMTPAAYHRSTGLQLITGQFMRNSTRLLLASMPFLGIGLALDVYIVGTLIFDDRLPATVAALLLVAFAFLWIIFPRSRWLQRVLDGGHGE